MFAVASLLVVLWHQTARQPTQAFASLRRGRMFNADVQGTFHHQLIASPAHTRGCQNGHITAPRSIFWRYLDGKTPALADVAHAEDRVYAVFNLKAPYLHAKWQQVKWHEASWSMLLHATHNSSTLLPAKALGVDAHHHTLIVYSTLPSQLLLNELSGVRVEISIMLNVSNGKGSFAKEYDRVPLCIEQPASTFHHLVGCTQVLPEVVHHIPEWIVYHSLVGFEHFYVYAENNVSLVQDYLQPLVHAGLVTVIDFTWPLSHKRGFWSQQAMQNSCLLRARGRARWVGLFDVDEFFQVLAPGNTTASNLVSDFLQQRSQLEHVSGFSVHSIWFGSNRNESVQAQHSLSGRNLVVGQEQVATPHTHWAGKGFGQSAQYTLLQCASGHNRCRNGAPGCLKRLASVPL